MERPGMGHKPGRLSGIMERTLQPAHMTDQTILAIDNGTQSVRALLFDLQGNIVAKSQVHLTPYFSDQPGWAEHDAEGYWHAVCEACRGLWRQAGVDKSRIQGVALTTQRGTVVSLDA